MKALYAKLVLWLIRPSLDAYHEQQVSERAKGKLISITQDIRKRVSGGELHL